MKNIHFVGEWLDCCAPRTLLIDAQAIQALCMAHVSRRHLPIRYEYFIPAARDGVIGALTGNDIHLIVRTFPCRDAVIADLFVAESEPADLAAAMQVFNGLRDEFRPLRALLHRMQHDGQSLPVQGRTPRKATEVFLTKPLRRVV
jgi:hypothetical protein